jgi:hypothetical protein
MVGVTTFDARDVVSRGPANRMAAAPSRRIMM